MESADFRNEAVAIAVAAGSVALAFAVVGLAKRAFPQIEGPVLVTLMLLPLVAYLIASGKLTEFKAPGGIEARFAATAKDTVRPASETIAYDDPQIVAREGGVRKLLARKAREIDQSRPVVMTMTIGGKVQYTLEDVVRYLDVLSQLRSFKLVVFLDGDKRVVAYMEAWVLKELVEQSELAGEFIELVNSGQIESVIGYPGIAKKTISTTSTNIDALREMQEQNLEALVVVDEQRMLRGVVERERVVTSMMLSLVR
jgi:CBS domain-containing protein